MVTKKEKLTLKINMKYFKKLTYVEANVFQDKIKLKMEINFGLKSKMIFF